MNSKELRDLYVEFARAGKVWEPKDYPLAKKLACVLAEFLGQRVQAVVESRPELPLLVSYQSDATSFLTRHAQQLKLEEQRAQRGGTQLSELLLERLFVKLADPVGERLAAIEIAPPRTMSLGKTNMNLLTAGVDFLPCVRPARSGIVVTHVAFDRAVFDGLAKGLRAYQKAQASEALRSAEVEVSPLRRQCGLVRSNRMLLPGGL